MSRHADPRRSCSTTSEKAERPAQETDLKGRERGEMASQMEFAEHSYSLW